jgi:hypothetical protein
VLALILSHGEKLRPFCNRMLAANVSDAYASDHQHATAQRVKTTNSDAPGSSTVINSVFVVTGATSKIMNYHFPTVTGKGELPQVAKDLAARHTSAGLPLASLWTTDVCCERSGGGLNVGKGDSSWILGVAAKAVLLDAYHLNARLIQTLDKESHFRNHFATNMCALFTDSNGRTRAVLPLCHVSSCLVSSLSSSLVCLVCLSCSNCCSTVRPSV